MNPYEVMFIVDPNVDGEEAVDGQIERFGRLIVDNGGTVTGVDKWGKRRFAYEIKGLTEGYYVVIQFKAEDSVVNELNRLMKIADQVVRHLVVRLDEKQVATDEPQEAEATEAPEETAAQASEQPTAP